MAEFQKQLRVNQIALIFSKIVEGDPNCICNILESSGMICLMIALCLSLLWCRRIMFYCFHHSKINYNNMFECMQWKQSWRVGNLSSLYKVWQVIPLLLNSYVMPSHRMFLSPYGCKNASNIVLYSLDWLFVYLSLKRKSFYHQFNFPASPYIISVYILLHVSLRIHFRSGPIRASIHNKLSS